VSHSPPRDVLPPPARSTAPEPEIRYSFKYLDTSHPRFQVAHRDGGYFRVLLARLRELSAIRISEFRSSRSGTLRVHRIDFGDQRVAVRGFGIPGGAGFDRHAWQFSLSANEHGRVHGFLVEDTFYVRWLDPDHNLYPG
jgi:hypothetical protein